MAVIAPAPSIISTTTTIWRPDTFADQLATWSHIAVNVSLLVLVAVLIWSLLRGDEYVDDDIDTPPTP